MDIEEALQSAATAPPASLAAILAAEILRLRGLGRCPDGWVEVWAIASADENGMWECHYTERDTMKTDKDRQKEIADYATEGRRLTLIRAYVPPPDPAVEVVGEVVGAE